MATISTMTLVMVVVTTVVVVTATMTMAIYWRYADAIEATDGHNHLGDAENKEQEDESDTYCADCDEDLGGDD
eukprot:5377851-Pyramimonas_sp.AAC.1